MYSKNWLKIFLLCASIIGFSIANEITNSTTASSSDEIGSPKVLSRKRRYLIFPDGSSFQLVFCAQNHGYLQVGDIVWFGNTAALAWELPTDPNIYQFFIKSEKQFLFGNRREDNKHIVYFDEDGKVLSKVPYHKKFIVNPAMAKRSLHTTAESNSVKPISKKDMHEAQKNRTFIHELDEMSIKFHRDGRKSLYAKIEKVLEGLGWSGKECLLRLLCQNAIENKEQGSFLEEIMKATFTFPKSTKVKELHEEYDVVPPSEAKCEQLYQECEDTHRVLF